MNKIELEIVALSSSVAQTHSYAVVLGEVNGTHKLPIVIGGFEAQAIAVALERIRPSRPLTHDLFANFMGAFNIELHEVIVYKMEDGIFYSKLVCRSEKEVLEIDSRTSDALALAVRVGCPIYTYQNILDKAGLYMDQQTGEFSGEPANLNREQDVPVEENKVSDVESLSGLSIQELHDLLQKVLDAEDYVKAIAIRDELKRRETK